MVRNRRSLGNMNDYGDIKYKWTPESTTLLVSVWTDKQVQKQLEYAQRPQLIWESVARYMTKKGYGVSAKQCRSRMKQVLVCYREAKRAGTRAGVEQYYDSIDKVLKNKKVERNDNGFDTVDSALVVESPPKDLKTDKNLRLRYNGYSRPVDSLVRTEALSPTWHLAYEEEYPDSPESNETVLAQPYRAFSPTRDAATNTLDGPSRLLAKSTRRSAPIEERPIGESRVIEQSPSNNRFGEMLYQNTVQNVQNQIIQENMQQRNLAARSESTREKEIAQPQQMYRRRTKRNPIVYPAVETVPSKLRVGSLQNRAVVASNDPPPSENIIRMQNQLQQTCMTDNRAVPQEPRREDFRQNFAINYELYKEAPAVGPFFDQNLVRMQPRTTRNYSPETAANLNDAFCQSPKDERRNNFNDSYEQQLVENEVIRAMNATTITNNATFNDDTLSIDFLEGSPSPSPSDNGPLGSKSVSGNFDKVPDAPVRKKKVQKLEQLMLSAITSQSDVVNKILAAQDAMVSRFLDLDRDRQNRLENRLDHLMQVVHATVMKKSPKDSDSDVVPSTLPEPSLITNLDPPPRPGIIPPKLDLVPPKPCRVPCTMANANVELVNQKTVETRPGVVSPIRPPGAIWSKLGPVSQSPFVKAQQQLGLRIAANPDTRTQSSAERRIAREMDSRPMYRRTLISESEKFLEVERRIEEQAENAKILAKMGEEVATRRKLFAGRGELNAGMILTAAFLDAERYATRADSATTHEAPVRENPPTGMLLRSDGDDDDDDEELMLLESQVEKYERLRRLKAQSRMPDEPCDTSTPAKPTREVGGQVPKQRIQQLAELVMKSARWRDAALNEKINSRFAPPVNNGSNIPSRGNEHSDVLAERKNDDLVKRANDLRDNRRSYAGEVAERESKDRALGWLQERYSYGGGDKIPLYNNNITNRRDTPLYDGPILSAVPVGPYPIGFTTENLIKFREQSEKQERNAFHNPIDLNPDYRRRNVAFAELEGPRELMEKIGQATYPRQRRQAPEPSQQQQQYHLKNYGQPSTLAATQKNMIDRYIEENRGIVARKQQSENGRRDSDDDDNDDEFLDTTMSMQPSRKASLTSSGTLSGKQGNCIIS